MRKTRPLEFGIGEATYRALPLCAYDQFRLLHTFAPILPAIAAVDPGSAFRDRVSALRSAEALVALDTEKLGAAMDAVTDIVERRVDEVWRSAERGLPLYDMVALILTVASYHFTAYHEIVRPVFDPVMREPLRFKPVTMPDDEDWLWRPVLAKLLPFTAAYDMVHRIEHFAKANHILDVKDENEARAHNSRKPT